MRRGNTIVEQVTKDGLLTEGYDESLSSSEIFDKISYYIPGVKELSNNKIIIGNYNGHKFAIRCKNVTYLGNPHPYYKKRIQISNDLNEFYNFALSHNAEPILMGIYSFKDNIIFVDFKIDTYIEKKAHNSSAHIYVSDLLAATVEGYFQKIDFFGNTITAIRPDKIEIYLEEILNVNSTNYKSTEKSAQKVESNNNTEIIKFPSESKFKNEIIPKIKQFFAKEEKNWQGIKCYKEMIKAGYKNKFQPEWAGFYLEYRFEKYLEKENLHHLICFAQDKKDGGIDLDLYFPPIDSYGDLKAHSEESRGIQGNDWETIFKIINGQDKKNHVYYIVCEHATEKDSMYGYEVAKYWNGVQRKSNIMSYSSRMKHNIILKKVYFLDINYSNKDYITLFRQGINSDGKPRAPKIMIESDKLKYFIIDQMTL